jgi:ribosomal protein L31
MQANPVAIRICNPCHPAYTRFDWLDEDFDTVSPANVYRGTNVIHR